MAGALGVDGLVVGSVAKFGEDYAMQVKILGAQDGQTLAASSGRVKSESAVLDWLEAAAQRFARTFQGKSNEPPPPAIAQRAPPAPRDATSPRRALRSRPRRRAAPSRRPRCAPRSGPAVSPFVPLGAGVALGVLGGLAYAQALHKLDQLNTGELGRSRRRSSGASRARGRTFEIAGYALLGAGLVGIGTGAYLFFATPAGPPTVSAGAAPGRGRDRDLGGAAVRRSGLAVVLLGLCSCLGFDDAIVALRLLRSGELPEPPGRPRSRQRRGRRTRRRPRPC